MENFYEYMFMKNLSHTLASKNIDVAKLCEAIVVAVDEQGVEVLNESLGSVWAGTKAVGSNIWNRHIKPFFQDVGKTYTTAYQQQSQIEADQKIRDTLAQLVKMLRIKGLKNDTIGNIIDLVNTEVKAAPETTPAPAAATS